MAGSGKQYGPPKGRYPTGGGAAAGCHGGQQPAVSTWKGSRVSWRDSLHTVMRLPPKCSALYPL